MEVSVLNIQGQDTGRKAVLNDAIYAIEPNEHVLYLDVKQYLGNQRQGTAKAKERSEVSGSTRKLGRQKGGGGARHGSLKSNIFVGGGRVFGPKPRLYRFKLNKKLKSLARCSALTYKAQENAIVLVEPFAMEAPKTKELMRILDALKAGQRKVLVVLPENSNNIFLSSRNLPEVKVITVDEINTYTVMNANSMVLVDGVQDVLAARVNR